jgi:hypothetical protein
MSSLLEQVVEDLRALSREERDCAARLLLALLDGPQDDFRLIARGLLSLCDTGCLLMNRQSESPNSEACAPLYTSTLKGSGMPTPVVLPFCVPRLDRALREEVGQRPGGRGTNFRSILKDERSLRVSQLRCDEI